MSIEQCAADDLKSLNRKRILANKLAKEVKKIKKPSKKVQEALDNYLKHKMWYEK